MRRQRRDRLHPARARGETVKYELGKEPKDRYDRTLAYLTRVDRMHNLALVEEGYATARAARPSYFARKK